MYVVHKLSRQLSLIHEKLAESERLVYIVIGPGAEVLSQNVCQTAPQFFPGLAQDQRGSSLMGAVRSMASSRSSSARSQNARGSINSSVPVSSLPSATDPFVDGDLNSCQFYKDGHTEIRNRRGQDKTQQEKAETDAAKLAEELRQGADDEKVSNESGGFKVTEIVTNLLHGRGSKMSSVVPNGRNSGARRSTTRSTTRSRKSSGRFSLASTFSKFSDVTAASGHSGQTELELGRQVVKTTFIPVENFGTEVPRCPTALHFKQACVLFLIDERDREADLLTDLQFRRGEVERWVTATLKRFDMKKLPHMMAAVLVHNKQGDDKSATPCAGFASEAEKSADLSTPLLPGGCPPKLEVEFHQQHSASADTTHSTASGETVRASAVSYSPPQDWKYKSFLQSVQELVKDQQIQYSCNFDDGVALLNSIVRVSALILKRRETDEGKDMEDADAGMETSESAQCCACCMM